MAKYLYLLTASHSMKINVFLESYIWHYHRFCFSQNNLERFWPIYELVICYINID